MPRPPSRRPAPVSLTRRRILGGGVASLAALTASAPFIRTARAVDPIRIGVLLPYSGVFAALGDRITKGLQLAVEQSGGTLGGRPVEWKMVDSEAAPSKAPERTARLAGSGVDLIVGPVHSGVALGMVRALRQSDTILIVPNAGAAAVTGEQCASHIFRTSFTNWQPAWPMGRLLGRRGIRRMATITWGYAAGAESAAGFREGFESEGGEVIREIRVPFLGVEFQSYIPELATSGADAVYAFFSGAGAVQFTKQYHDAGLRERIPLYGVGFLTEGTLDAQGASAEGLETTMHYADDLPAPGNAPFRANYKAAFGETPDVFSVQGYDTGLLLRHGFEAVEGDTQAREDLLAAFRGFDGRESPRGAWKFSKAQNPIQDIYLRQVEGGQNLFREIAEKAVEDPALGCTL